MEYDSSPFVRLDCGRTALCPGIPSHSPAGADAGLAQHRVAHLRRRSAQHALHAARSDQPRQLQHARRSRGGSRPTRSARDPSSTSRSTPLVVNGVLYTTAGSRRAVVALDAETGELLWMHRLDEGKRGEAAPRTAVGPRTRLLDRRQAGRASSTSRPGYQMIALDAKTGLPRAVVRQERHRRSQARERSGGRSRDRRHRTARDADHRQTT